MKKNFTLLFVSLFCSLASAFGQFTLLNQSFTNTVSTPSNYPGWVFNTNGGVLYWTATQNNHTITAGTLVFDQSNANGVVTSTIQTSDQQFSAGPATISFNYDLHGNLSGGSYRKVVLSLIDGNGNSTALDSLVLNSAMSGVQTFSTTKTIPAIMQRKLQILLEGKSSGSTFLLIDNLNIAYPAGIVPVPVKLASFQGNMDKNNLVTLQWQVADNENAGYFEVQRSFNGNDFSTVGIVKATDAMGTENYQYLETLNANEKVMYRLKMVDKYQAADYSRIVVVRGKKPVNGSAIKLYGNPVRDKIRFSLSTSVSHAIRVKVYDMNAHLLLSQDAVSNPGDNLITVSLAESFKPGLYMMEINDGAEKFTARFVKQ